MSELEAAINQAAAWEGMARRAELARDKAVARAEAAEAERDAWEAKFDSAWADMRRIVAAGPEAALAAAEARIAAALAITPDEGAGTYECDEDEGFANGWNEALAAVRAALVEPVEPQPSACANPECRGGWVRNPSGLPLCSENGILGHSPCPSCTPPDPESETRG